MFCLPVLLRRLRSAYSRGDGLRARGGLFEHFRHAGGGRRSGSAVRSASHREITRALKDILLDAELRGRMERLGLQRASTFTWKKSARATLDVYTDVVNSGLENAPRGARGGQRPASESDDAGSMVNRPDGAACHADKRCRTPNATGPDRLSLYRRRSGYSVNWPSGIAWAKRTCTPNTPEPTGRSIYRSTPVFPALKSRTLPCSKRCPISVPLVSTGQLPTAAAPQEEQETIDRTRSTTRCAPRSRAAARANCDAPACVKDALTFLFYARREMGQGRVPPPNSPVRRTLQISVDYTGAPMIRDRRKTGAVR